MGVGFSACLDLIIIVIIFDSGCIRLWHGDSLVYTLWQKSVPLHYCISRHNNSNTNSNNQLMVSQVCAGQCLGVQWGTIVFIVQGCILC